MTHVPTPDKTVLCHQDLKGPPGVLAALARARQAAQRIARQTHTKVIVNTHSSVSQRLGLPDKS